ncbi:MAG: SIS domain-containing protein [Bacteroidia bacterium]
MHTLIQQKISDSIQVKTAMLANEALLLQVFEVIRCTSEALLQGKSVWFCGNGGSAADAQHLAAELSGRFYKDRKALPAEALHVNTSYLTAVANDYGYEEVYARLLDGVGKTGDVLFAISTSGNSLNIIKAIEVAKKKGLLVVGMTGESGGKMLHLCDYLLNVPSNNTPRIQEAHILLGHIVCEGIELNLFP